MKPWRLIVFLLVLHLFSEAYGANLIQNGGFETGSPALGPRPTSFGQWQGDKVGYTHAENGISTPEGTTMLRFFFTSGGSPSPSADTSQYWQNIDLSSFSPAIASGNARLSASALFNRLPGNAQTDTVLGFQLIARSGTPSAFTELSRVGITITSDGDPNTWELAAFNDFVLPPTTTHVQFELDAREDVFNNGTGTEFDGHYADNVVVTMAVPEPSGFALIAAAAACVLAASRARRVLRRSNYSP